jgi:UDP:flavonoid glycosyltransferase YjiC (YdhE family)
MSKRNLLTIFMEQKILSIFSFSPNLMQQPKDWSNNNQICGFLTSPNVAIGLNEKNIELENWLIEGEKPIYIGFGSIPIPDAKKLGEIINDILIETNHRIIFSTGWSKIENLPVSTNLFVIEKSNHQWLFPKCKLIVFHGGTGTLAAALQAKVPMIVLSVFGDQPMWGKIIQKKEIGVHIKFKNLTTSKLIAAIDETQKHEIKTNSIKIGQSINEENSLELTVDTIEGHLK